MLTFSRCRNLACRLVLIQCLFLSHAARAATFTLEQVMSSPFPSNLVAASRSSRVAWVFDAKGVRNLWVADAPNFAARQVTHYEGDEGLPMASLRITSDGRTLVYVVGSEINESGRVADPTNAVEPRKQQVWAVDVDAGIPRMLGEIGCGQEECEDVELSPDGQFAVWAARKQLWIAPVTGATPAHQLTELRGDNSNPRWSPDGRQIALVSDRGDHRFIAIYDFGRDSVHYLAPSADRDGMPRWSPDGRKVAFVRLPGSQAEASADSGAHRSPGRSGLQIPQLVKAKKFGTAGTKQTIRFPRRLPTNPFTSSSNDRLVFASEQDGWNHLYVYRPFGGSSCTSYSGLVRSGRCNSEH